MQLSTLDYSPIVSSSCVSSENETTVLSPPSSPMMEEDDVDANDYESEMLWRDQLSALLKIQDDYQVSFIPCAAQSRNQQQQQQQRLPHDEWRRKICEWCFRVIDHFRLERECVAYAMNFFDRFLSQRSFALSSSTTSSLLYSNNANNNSMQQDDQDQDRPCTCPSCLRAMNSKTFQLAAMTALYMAIKLHGESSDTGIRKRLKLASFVDLSRRQFTAQDITDMEIVMLTTLKWRVNPITPTSFISLFLPLIPLHHRQQQQHDHLVHLVLNELSRYLVELSVCMAHITTTTSSSSSCLASEVAFASILVAMEALTVKALPRTKRCQFCNTIRHLTRMDPTVGNLPALIHRLGTAFSPQVLSLSREEEQHNHPLWLACNAGLLEPQLFYSSSSSSSWWSSSSSSISSSNSANQQKSLGNHRNQSVTSVMDVPVSYYVSP